MTIRERLFSLRDEPYRKLTITTVPNIAPERIIGVRLPALRAMAKELAGKSEAEAFLADPAHEYLEEQHLHAFFLDHVRSVDEVLARVEAFLPHVDNWASCDSLVPKALRRNPDVLPPHIDRWIASPHTYTARFAVGLLMRLFLEERFDRAQMDRVAALRSEQYYLRMMVAWYMATACAKQYDAALAVLRENRLDAWTHNKTIQKAVESFRVTDEHKDELRALRRRGK